MYKRIPATALAALLMTAGVQAEAPPQGFQLVYDPATGSLTIDTGGHTLFDYSVAIAFDAPASFPDEFNTANFTPLGGGLLETATSTQITGLNLTGWTIPPTSIGEVLPQNLTQAQLERGIVATFNTTDPESIVVSGVDDGVITGGVPEPTTIALLAAGSLLIARRRREA